MHFAEPKSVTQVRYFGDSPNHISMQLNAKSVDLSAERKRMPGAGATEDSDSDNDNQTF